MFLDGFIDSRASHSDNIATLDSHASFNDGRADLSLDAISHNSVSDLTGHSDTNAAHVFPA